LGRLGESNFGKDFGEDRDGDVARGTDKDRLE
jgi:hypothetical protein